MTVPVPCLGYPTRKEAMIALKEQGKSYAEIAQAVGISTDAARSQVNRYAGDSTAYEHRCIRKASARLLAALQEHHPETRA